MKEIFYEKIKISIMVFYTVGIFTFIEYIYRLRSESTEVLHGGKYQGICSVCVKPNIDSEVFVRIKRTS